MLDVYTDFAVREAAVPVNSWEKIGLQSDLPGRSDVFNRSHDGRRQSIAVGHVAQSRPEFCKKLLRFAISTRAAASALLDYFLGPFHAIYWRYHHVHGDDQGFESSRLA